MNTVLVNTYEKVSAIADGHHERPRLRARTLTSLYVGMSEIEVPNSDRSIAKKAPDTLLVWNLKDEQRRGVVDRSQGQRPRERKNTATTEAEHP